MSLNQIVTPLDSAVLETKEQYRAYFQIITHAFRQLVRNVSKEGICSSMEATLLGQYCELLIYSLEAFRIKYLFDAEERMRVDLTESGFPNYLEFRYLFNDLELKQEHLGKLPEISTLKEGFLQSLLRDKEPVSDYKMHQAASIVYYTSVDQQFIYRRFVQGKIIASTEVAEANYMVSWSFYDVSANRPFICYMYFSLENKDPGVYRDEIYKVLEKTADRDMDISVMAYAIDKKLPFLQPKKLRKIDLGPLHSVFAKDELQVTHVLLKAIAGKVLEIASYALAVSIDEVVSKGNFAEGRFFNRQQLQLWEPAKNQQYLFTSHRVMQTLYDQIPDILRKLTREPVEFPQLKLT